MEPEAATMIGRLSPTLSWLDTCATPRDSLKSCFRRALIYPLYRSFSLAVAAVQDTITLIGSGRIKLTKILLHLRSLFNRRDPFYILNQLYIDSYIVWLQSRARVENMSKLARNLVKFTMTKESVDLDLVMLEHVARIGFLCLCCKCSIDPLLGDNSHINISAGTCLYLSFLVIC